MSQSTLSATRRKASQPKPKKPHKDFPLFPHATGRWAKKVKGKFQYFGKVEDDPNGQAALALWLDQKDDLLAGRKPREAGDGLTTKDLCNRFLTSKQRQLDSGEITNRTFTDYKFTTDRIITQFGKTRRVDDIAADDFEALRADISKETRKLLDELKIYRKGLGFYALRHTFRTVADATRDFPAVNHVMGHSDDTMGAVYRETIADDRLRAVADHVRSWLFDDPEADGNNEEVEANESDVARGGFLRCNERRRKVCKRWQGNVNCMRCCRHYARGGVLHPAQGHNRGRD